MRHLDCTCHYFDCVGVVGPIAENTEDVAVAALEDAILVRSDQGA